MPVTPPKTPFQVESSLLAKAASCGPDPKAPTAVLPLMVTARLGSTSSFERLQGTIDYLTCVGKAGRPFTENEKEFMHDLFEAFALGGRLSGMPQAAALADHYVNGKGKFLELNPEVYQTSVIVKDTMSAMTAFIVRTIGNQGNMSLASNNPAFGASKEASILLARSGRSQKTRGVLIVKDGKTTGLLAEQDNRNLKHSDNRFNLRADATRQANNQLIINWTVRSKYDFDPFAKSDITRLPLGVGKTLLLPDGLSHYLTEPYIGVAFEFEHEANWKTVVDLRGKK